MNFINNLLPTIQHLGYWGYWLVLLVSLVESLAFVGTVVPGAVVVVFAGFLSAQGYLDLGDLIWFAAIGAILGDSISYYLGTKGTKLFKNENRFLKASHLDAGKKFFEKHGNKSIFLGRFVGLLRPIIPFVAGLLRMDKRSFFFWNIISGFLWAVTHLLFGYFFGGAIGAIEAWSGRLSIFIVAIAALIVLIWFLVKKSHGFWRFIKSVGLSIKEAVTKNQDVQKFVHKHPKLTVFFQHRLDRKEFTGLPLTILVIAFVYVLFLFIGIVQDVLTSDLIVAADIRIENLLYAFRDPSLIKIFLWITLLGKVQIVISIAIIASILLWLLKKRVYIFSLWFILAGSELFVFLGKLVVHRSRPGELIPFYQEHSLSFPSGHATIAVVLYGFLVYILWKKLKQWKYKTTSLFLGLIIIFLIGLSRMYLGVHFLSDVLGGYLVGLLWLIAGITITEWYISKKSIDVKPIHLSPKVKYVAMSLIAIELIFYGVYAHNYKPVINTYQSILTVQNVVDPLQIFSEKNSPPKFSEGLLGDPQEPISLIIVAKNDEELVSVFKLAGWYRADPVTFDSLVKTAKAVFLHQQYLTAPMTPSFWNAKVHDFGFEKPTDTNTVAERHHARIWKTNVQTPDGRFIYVGTMSFDKGIKWAVTHKIEPDLDTERELLFSDLQKSNVIEQLRKEQFVDPIIGQNFAGDQFFTDGKAYILYII